MKISGGISHLYDSPRNGLNQSELTSVRSCDCVITSVSLSNVSGIEESVVWWRMSEVFVVMNSSIGRGCGFKPRQNRNSSRMFVYSLVVPSSACIKFYRASFSRNRFMEFSDL